MNQQQYTPSSPQPHVPTDGAAVLCPLCEYDLRGLIEPRCPECGYQFVWAELLDPERRRHPYLFEQHPQRNIGSFVRTAMGGLRPRRFWKLLQPQQPSNPRRLLVYWSVCTGLLAFIGAVLLVGDAIVMNAYPKQFRSLDSFQFVQYPQRDLSNNLALIQNLIYIKPPPPPVTVPSAVQALMSVTRVSQAMIYSTGIVAIWTMATYLSLMVLQDSMIKAGVKMIHVARCVFYSYDVGLWLIPALGIAMALEQFGVGPQAELSLILALLGYIPLTGYRLWVAYREYLKFDHPFWVMLASQIIAGLVMMIVLINLSLEHWI